MHTCTHTCMCAHTLQYIHIAHRHIPIHVLYVYENVYENVSVCVHACRGQNMTPDVFIAVLLPWTIVFHWIRSSPFLVGSVRWAMGLACLLALNVQHGPLLTGAGDYTQEPHACRTSTLTHSTISQPWYFVFINTVHIEIIIYSILENF